MQMLWEALNVLLELAKGNKLEVKHYSFGFNYMFTAFSLGGAFCLFYIFMVSPSCYSWNYKKH